YVLLASQSQSRRGQTKQERHSQRGFDVRSTVIAYLEVRGILPIFPNLAYVGCLACREQSEV
ncbi:MAG: hypothetical protein WB662_01050, partial [Methyloceanibacter sp.]